MSTFTAGLTAVGSQANLNNRQAELPGINAAIDQRLVIIREMEARVQALRAFAARAN